MYICYQNPTAMKRLIPLFLSALPALVCCGGPSGPVDAVDPTIGGVSVLLETTRQTVHLPNQMLRFVPLRADMLDDWIDDFALQMADHRRHWVFGLMPFCTADTTAATMLNTATRLPSVVAPIEASKAVKQVPMVAPMSKNRACSTDSVLALMREMRIPVVAEEDWMRAVNRAPTNTSSRGKSMALNILTKKL